MLKNIVFDLGNVVIEWDANRVYDKYFATPELREEFYATTQIKELNVEFDRGLPFAEGLSLLAQKHPHYADAIWLWKNSWTEMLGDEISGTLALIPRLQEKGYNLYALTNWAHETFIHAETNFTWLNNFIDIVVSGRENVIKPDHRIFQLLLNRNNLKAEESVFIDDSLANVNAARELGFAAIHFQNPQQLLAELERLKLL